MQSPLKGGDGHQPRVMRSTTTLPERITKGPAALLRMQQLPFSEGFYHLTLTDAAVSRVFPEAPPAAGFLDSIPSSFTSDCYNCNSFSSGEYDGCIHIKEDAEGRELFSWFGCCF